MSVTGLPIIDFHSHYFDPRWRESAPTKLGAAPRVWPLLTDLDAQLAALEDAGISAKVLTAPPSSLAPAGEALDSGLIREINDTLAGDVAEHPARLYALGTIDAFQGKTAALEVERVICRLGFGGIVVDCARDGLWLDAREARPALEAAAALGALVFVHPISPPGLSERLSSLGPTGVLMARGLETAASIHAIQRSGVLDDLPELRLVIPAIAASALVFASFANRYGRDEGWHGSLPGESRKRLYIDTMGLDPALVRYSIDLLGIDHVLFGTDWPIMPIATREHVIAALTAAGVTSMHDQAAILSGNLLQLLSRCLRPGRDGQSVRAAGSISDLLRAESSLLQPVGAAEWDWVVR